MLPVLPAAAAAAAPAAAAATAAAVSLGRGMSSVQHHRCFPLSRTATALSVISTSTVPAALSSVDHATIASVTMTATRPAESSVTAAGPEPSATYVRCRRCLCRLPTVVLHLVATSQHKTSVADLRGGNPAILPQSGHSIQCGHLILKKISKIGATRCPILRLKCAKFDFP